MPRAFRAMLVIFAVIVGTLLLWLAKPAHAQGMSMVTVSVCNTTATVLKLLTDKYHEVAIGGGINKKGEQLRLYVSPTSWTVLLTRPDGISCLVQVSGADGEWVVAPPEILGEKS